jgi:hypothetical protein
MDHHTVKRLELLTLGMLALVGVSLCLTNLGQEASNRARESEISALQDSFRVPPDDTKLMVRWWWFGPAVTAEELDREMHAMKDAGIGGFEVEPVYPLTLDDPGKGLVNLGYLSPEFLAAVSTTARTAHTLGMRMDMTVNSGWPYGGPHITPELAAQRLICLRVPVREGSTKIPAPKLKEDQRFLAAFIASGDEKHLDASSIREVTEREKDSFVLPSLPSGPGTLLVFVMGPTGMRVKRPAVGAEGLVLDHYRRAALEKHLEVVGEPLAKAGGGNIRAMFCDSLEVYQSDWTKDFLEEFQRRRGYDLKPYLPALVADIGPPTAAIRHDWGETLTELLNENFLAPFQKWCHARHVLCRVQAYGQPPADLSSYKFVDLPEGEQGDEAGHWNDFTASRWASSAGHLEASPVISAEAWTWIHALSFRATPLDFKAGADEYFLEGINQLVGHGWPYSPPGVPEPGWYFYAGGALNQHNPWWFAMPDLALYLERASFMLRQGKPANDIAVYLPTHDAWATLTPGKVNLWEAIWQRLGSTLVPSLLEAGYNLDFVDDDALARLAHSENGKLVIRDQAFPIVILPGVERIPPSILAKLADFARRGGNLIATRRLPSCSPGFINRETESAKVARQVDELFKRPPAPAHFISDEGKELAEALRRLNPPDVAFSPATRSIGFIHRRTASAEIYFIANTSNERAQTRATFRVRGKKPEWWDLFTGEATIAQWWHGSGDGVLIPLDLEPYGSRLLIFTDRDVLGGRGQTELQNLPPPLDISHGWDVAFEGTGKKMVIDTLRSWTELEGMRHFSGLATYHKTLVIPADFLRNGIQVDLNLGEPTAIPIHKNAHFQAWLDGPVREAAEVFVNGHRAGVIWHPPYELDVRPFFHPGENELRIVVGNLAVNEMASRPWPNHADLTARYGERFVDQGSELLQPVPSGLTGPIRLIARAIPAAVRSDP